MYSRLAPHRPVKCCTELMWCGNVTQPFSGLCFALLCSAYPFLVASSGKEPAPKSIAIVVLVVHSDRSSPGP